MILDGKSIAKEREKELAEEIKKLPRAPGLSFILVGDNPASKKYIGVKKRACARLGINSFDYELEEDVSLEEVKNLVLKLNADPLVDGILLQLPLPAHLPAYSILSLIDPRKDVDGFHPWNMGSLLIGETPYFFPCTPKGIYHLLHHYHIPLQGKKVTIVGRSAIVGKPLAAMMLRKKEDSNATVTITHQYTSNLQEHTLSADIIVAALGKPHLIKSSMLKKGVVVIDVGISLYQGKLEGDVDPKALEQKASYYTPVPGGVGPMTVLSLMENCLLAYKNRME